MSLKVAVIYGTRPEAIKCAPVIRALMDCPSFTVIPILTGQHSASVIREITDLYGFQETKNLDILVPGQTLNQLASRALERIDTALSLYTPDAVMAQGDTTTVAMTAISAYNQKIPFIHLEAGLRTSTLSEPHPEEGNRRIATHLTSLHLAPTHGAKQNLLRENISENDIAVTGNTVIDALHYTLNTPPSENSSLGSELRHAMESSRRIILVTTHRRENWGNLDSIGEAMRQIAQTFPDDILVYVSHPNVQIRKQLDVFIGDLNNVIITDPLGYHDFAHLINASYLVLTDSGGIQEEAPSLGKPVLVMREHTERPEAIHAGTVSLTGKTTGRIVSATTELLTNSDAYTQMARAVNPYGDGQASGRVVAAIADFFNLGTRLPDFKG